jgi:protein-disulfide isomerase
MRENTILHYAIGIALVLMGGLVALGVWSLSRDGTGAESRGGAGAGEYYEGELPVLGDEDAPVTLVEFGDYRCAVCARFFGTTEMRIREEFIKTGKVKMYWRDFAFLGPDSRAAAEAARCAGEQGAFWAYHDALLTRTLSNEEFSSEDLRAIAAEGGVDTEAFDACFSSGRYREAVEADRREGRGAGVQGTPTFFINGRRVAGAQPYEVLRAVILEESER